jgi:hypothetical protein
MAGVSEGEKKMMGLQYQMRQNQQDLTSYLKELDSWLGDFETKVKVLKKTKVDTAHTTVRMRASTRLTRWPTCMNMQWNNCHQGSISYFR